MINLFIKFWNAFLNKIISSNAKKKNEMTCLMCYIFSEIFVQKIYKTTDHIVNASTSIHHTLPYHKYFRYFIMHKYFCMLAVAIIYCIRNIIQFKMQKMKLNVWMLFWNNFVRRCRTVVCVHFFTLFEYFRI